MDDYNIEAVGYCTECGNRIIANDDVYIDSDGNYFDGIECVFSYYNISKVEF